MLENEQVVLLCNKIHFTDTESVQLFKDLLPIEGSW